MEWRLFLFWKGRANYEVRRAGTDPLRLRDCGCHLKRGKENDRRHSDCGNGPHARPVQRAGRRVRGIRDLSGVPRVLRFPHLLPGQSLPQKLRGVPEGRVRDRAGRGHPHPQDPGDHRPAAHLALFCHPLRVLMR